MSAEYGPETHGSSVGCGSGGAGMPKFLFLSYAINKFYDEGIRIEFHQFFLKFNHILFVGTFPDCVLIAVVQEVVRHLIISVEIGWDQLEKFG